MLLLESLDKLVRNDQGLGQRGELEFFSFRQSRLTIDQEKILLGSGDHILGGVGADQLKNLQVTAVDLALARSTMVSRDKLGRESIGLVGDTYGLAKEDEPKEVAAHRREGIIHRPREVEEEEQAVVLRVLHASDGLEDVVIILVGMKLVDIEGSLLGSLRACIFARRLLPKELLTERADNLRLAPLEGLEGIRRFLTDVPRGEDSFRW